MCQHNVEPADTSIMMDTRTGPRAGQEGPVPDPARHAAPRFCLVTIYIYKAFFYHFLESSVLLRPLHYFLAIAYLSNLSHFVASLTDYRMQTVTYVILVNFTLKLTPYGHVLRPIRRS